MMPDGMFSTANLMIAVAAFVVMEPATYLLHRFVMHGAGWGWHRSHHRSYNQADPPRLERNDWFPVVFAVGTIAVMALGVSTESLRFLVPLGVGVTAYGLAYALVHDGYIHGRLPWPRLRRAGLDRLAESHSLHHRFGGEPYGMLVPVVPAALRRRAERSSRSHGQAPGAEESVAGRVL